ncbi:MAG: Mu-like prophage major head subunit gpT family protein [Methylococcaceae bacterium]
MQLTSANIRALQVGFNTTFNNAFNDAPSDYDKIAMTTASTHSSETYAWMGKTTGFREWLGDRVIQNLAASDYSIKNRKFENTIGIDRDDIEDDSFGVYTPMMAQLGQDAKAHPDLLVFDLLKNGFTNACFDGQYFFDTDHPVGSTVYSNHGGGASTPWFLIDASKALKPIIFQKRRDYKFVAMDKLDDEVVFNTEKFRYGVDARVNVGYGLPQLAYASKQTLDLTNYAAARAAMRSLKGDNGRVLNINPTLLVVPPSLEAAALQLLNAEMINNTSNTLRGTATLLVTPWLV